MERKRERESKGYVVSRLHDFISCLNSFTLTSSYHLIINYIACEYSQMSVCEFGRNYKPYVTVNT